MNGLTYREGLHFNYPPMAAAVFGALSYVPLSAMKCLVSVGSVAALTVVSWLTWGSLGYLRSLPRLAGSLAVTAVAIWAEQVQQALALGQVNIMLMLIIVVDLSVPADADAASGQAFDLNQQAFSRFGQRQRGLSRGAGSGPAAWEEFQECGSWWRRRWCRWMG